MRRTWAVESCPDLKPSSANSSRIRRAVSPFCPFSTSSGIATRTATVINLDSFLGWNEKDRITIFLSLLCGGGLCRLSILPMLIEPADDVQQFRYMVTWPHLNA